MPAKTDAEKLDSIKRHCLMLKALSEQEPGWPMTEPERAHWDAVNGTYATVADTVLQIIETGTSRLPRVS
jgi:hypothetical protein